MASLNDIDVTGKRVLVRMDINVPMQDGKVRDMTRITRQLPTLQSLIKRGAKVVIISHFGRPSTDSADNEKFSLKQLVQPMSEALAMPVVFANDCIGEEASNVVNSLNNGEVAMLENLRFHAGEKSGDEEFAKALAENGDIYVNDAFSCAHRAHASMVGLAKILPAYAGASMTNELKMLGSIFDAPKRPVGAVIGGAKVSSKLTVLEFLLEKVDILMIGGAMAHTFLVAQGNNVGKSLYEPELIDKATEILDKAEAKNCRIILPVDLVVTEEFAANAANNVVPVDGVPENMMALDVGIESVDLMRNAVRECESLIWNGPLGAFEFSPFDMSTVALAREAAVQTASGNLLSVAGGGDTVAALSHAGLMDSFTYISTAGGAFLEWMEGKKLPGVAALY